MLPDGNRSRFGRRVIKRFLYWQMSLLDGFNILLGRSEARVPFTVKADPASVYYNFRVRADSLESFTAYANLPADFSICPVRCIEGEPAEFTLTLNVYAVSGITSGTRAEWSTYVLDPRDTPRFMVLEAVSSTYSMDPVDIVTRKGRVEHRTRDGRVTTSVASPNGGLLQARYTVPADAPTAKLDPEWLAANDYIYWRNGICDRAFYDAGLAQPRALLLPGAVATIDDQTHWAQFLEPQPKHIIHFQNAIDFVIQPWANL